MADSKVITQNDIKNILAHINLGDDAHREITQAEFNALSQAEKNDGTIYFITDGVSGSVFLEDNVPIGTITPYGGDSDPDYWLICDGRAISRTTYADLFAVIGTTYGTGDGSTTFNIPDLRGNVAVGASAIYDLGDSGGEATHTLSISEMPSHNHSQYANVGNAATGQTNLDDIAGCANINAQNQLIGARTTSDTGGGQAHNNMQPYVVTNYIIKAYSTVSEHQATVDFFYPVGSYYETSDSTFDPNIRWGGTWVLEAEGKVHIGAGENYELGDTGGKEKVTLSAAIGSGYAQASSLNFKAENANAYQTAIRTGTYNVVGASYTTNQSWSHSTPVTEFSSADRDTSIMQPYVVVNRWHRTA